MSARKSSRLTPPPKASGSWRDAAVFVFDVEGTLVDAVMPTLRCWRETLEAFGHDVTLADLHRLTGMDANEMLAQLLPGTGKSERENMIERQGQRFREEYLPHIPAFPDVRPSFEELKRQNRKIALATDCKKEQLRHYFAVTQVEDLVDAIGCGEDVRHGKPHPDVVEVALRRVRAGRKPAVMIGDTPFDAAAARKVGIQAVGVLTGHFSEDALVEGGCDAVLRDVAALHDRLMQRADETVAASAPAA